MPGVAGRVEIARGVVGVAKVAESGRLPIAVADFSLQGEGFPAVGEGVPGISEQAWYQPMLLSALAWARAPVGGTGQGQCLLGVGECLLGTALLPEHRAKDDVAVGLADLVAELLEQAQACRM